MWVFIYFLIGILIALGILYMFYREDGGLTLDVRSILQIIIAIMIWPISITIILIWWISEHLDKEVINITKKEEKEEE